VESVEMVALLLEHLSVLEQLVVLVVQEELVH
jgi:hypothetical protein